MPTAKDLTNGLRRRLWPPLHSLIDTVFDAYAVSKSTEEEYAATVSCTRGALGEKLEEMGFSRAPVAALKVRVDGNVSDGSWVYRESLFAPLQLHLVVHEFPARDAIDVYAHIEDNWLRHPLKHLRKRNYRAAPAVTQVRTLFDSYAERSELAYEIRPRYRRENKWLLFFLYSVSKPAASRLKTLFRDEQVEKTV